MFCEENVTVWRPHNLPHSNSSSRIQCSIHHTNTSTRTTNSSIIQSSRLPQNWSNLGDVGCPVKTASFFLTPCPERPHVLPAVSYDVSRDRTYRSDATQPISWGISMAHVCSVDCTRRQIAPDIMESRRRERRCSSQKTDTRILIMYGSKGIRKVNSGKSWLYYMMIVIISL